jgi:hypothetical protein
MSATIDTPRPITPEKYELLYRAQMSECHRVMDQRDAWEEFATRLMALARLQAPLPRGVEEDFRDLKEDRQ